MKGNGTHLTPCHEGIRLVKEQSKLRGKIDEEALLQNGGYMRWHRKLLSLLMEGRCPRVGMDGSEGRWGVVLERQ